uniref:Uncharacterized protein n=1 Tax=Entomoneis paludosa TaxID=265537 RepID=A0A7S3DWK4_9STRA
MQLPHLATRGPRRVGGPLYESSSPLDSLRDDNPDRDDDDNSDWRAFRAKLVQQQQQSSNNNNNNDDPSSWTYNAGLLVEKGSLLISRVESSLGCHDLRQPYFAKCVILIIDHDDTNSEEAFTQGIILNRPSNLQLQNQDIVYVDEEGNPLFEQDENEDDDKSDMSWNMFFGGDIAGLYDANPMISCLHNITTDAAQSVSDPILPGGVQLTSHLAARGLVEASSDQGNKIQPHEFFTFYGFCGWDPGQLQREVERGSWYLVSTDPQTLWKELQSMKESNVDPRSVGLDMWERIIQKVEGDPQPMNDGDKAPTSITGRNDFPTLMLKEWATEMLLLSNNNPHMDDTNDPEEAVTSTPFLQDADIFRALAVAATPPTIVAGTLLRASPVQSGNSGTSPFLLQEQYLHKSILLVIQESDDFSVSVVLNLPTTESYVVELSNGQSVEFPIRYGGPGGNDENAPQPLLWFHNHDTLKQVGIGKPLSSNNDDHSNDVWTCSLDQVVEVLEGDLVPPSEFMVVQGFCVWEKSGSSSPDDAPAGGILGQVLSGNLNVVSDKSKNEDEAKTQPTSDNIWSTLTQQTRLSEDSIQWNFERLIHTWNLAAKADDSSVPSRFVYDSNVQVSTLADDALMAWIKIFLLGNAEYYV